MNIQSILCKLLSGRFVLTLAGAYCFCIIAKTICTIMLNKSSDISFSDLNSILATLLVVISNIFTFYFVRKELRGPNNEPGIPESPRSPENQ